MSGFAYCINPGHPARVPIEEALDGKAQLVWVHLATNNAEAQAWLGERAGLEADILEALTADETRPRCAAFGHGALLNLRGRSKDEVIASEPLASVRIWAVKGHVYSVVPRPLLAIDAVVAAVEAGQIVDPGDLLTEFATAITTDLDPVVADMGDQLDTSEECLDADRVFELRRTVTRVRVTAIGYRRFLAPQRAALEKLATLPGDWLGDDDRRHLSAAADRAARMAEEMEAIRERAGVIHEMLTDLRAEQIDSRGLVIAIAAMVFLPLTFITGVYGMNVKGLPYADEPWAFDAVMGGCAVIAAGIVIYFVRRHWFSRQ